MTKRRRSKVLSGATASTALLAVALAGCHRAPTPSPIPNQGAVGDDHVTSAISPVQAVLLDAYGLPPPSEESIREVELLKQHHADEERDRRLRFDQRKIEEHRAVVALLAKARSSYDAARSPAAVDRAKSRFAPLLVAMKKRAAAIDPWGNNSNVSADYAPLFSELATEYPDLVEASLQRVSPELAVLRSQFDERMAHIDELLRQAEEVEQE